MVSRNRQNRRWSVGLLCVLALSTSALVGCGKDTSGSDRPPATLGSMKTPWFGCPDLAGDYLWPPARGEYSDGEGFPKTGTWPVAIWEGRYQVSIEEENSRITVKAYKLYEDDAGQEQIAKSPAYVEYDGSQFTCSGGMLRITPTSETPQDDHGGSGLMRGYRLARMKDGSLAVGVETVVTGRRDSAVKWGDQSAGEYDLPDKTIFTWSALKPTL